MIQETRNLLSSKPLFLQSVVDIFDELGDNLGAELVLGDPPREVSDDRLGRVTVKVSTLQNEMAVSSKPGAPTFDPGEALAAQFSTPRQCGDGRTCSGVLLKLVQFEDNLISEDPNNRDDNVEIYNSQVWIAELEKNFSSQFYVCDACQQHAPVYAHKQKHLCLYGNMHFSKVVDMCVCINEYIHENMHVCMVANNYTSVYATRICACIPP